MTKARILVVEDESVIAMDIQSGLKSMGYDVPAIASSGEEAIRQADLVRPDLILMDIVLGGDLDGVEAAKRIYATHNIPIIYLTAYSDNKTIQRAKITEPFGYILKPFDERELQTAIEMALYKYKMERRVKESEQWLATTLRSIGDAVIATDRNGCISFMNPVAETLTGWKEEEALGLKLEEVLDIISEEQILVSRNGTRRPIDDSIAPIKDDNGGTLGTVLIFRDISERKLAEEKLRWSEIVLRSMAENSPQAFYMVDDSTDDILYFNHRFCQLWAIEHLEEDMKQHKLKNKDVFTYILPMLKDIPSFIASTRPLQTVEYRDTIEDELPFNDGRVIRRFSTQIRDSSGDYFGRLYIYEDITERKQAEEALKRAHADLEQKVQERTAELVKAVGALQAEVIERKNAENKIAASLMEKEVLLREIHHRVKNNLQIISSLLYLQAKNVDQSTALDAFKESHNRIKSMALVHEKLYRSKNLAGIEISDYIHNLTSYLFQSYGVSADRIERKIFIENIQLGIDTAIPCGLIVNELVSNSLKHAFKEGQKGEIRIELRTIGEGMYRMVIADNGVGMDTSLDLEKRQTLGLQLVNALVKQIDGKIKVESGPGTRYEIEFQEMKYKERK